MAQDQASFTTEENDLVLPIAVGGKGNLDLGPAANDDVPRIGILSLAHDRAATRDDEHLHAPARQGDICAP
jgi:hypothetical protein